MRLRPEGGMEVLERPTDIDDLILGPPVGLRGLGTVAAAEPLPPEQTGSAEVRSADPGRAARFLGVTRAFFRALGEAESKHPFLN